MSRRQPPSNRSRRRAQARSIGDAVEQGFGELRAGRIDAAAEKADRAVRDAPRHHGALNLAGLVALARHDTDTAIRRLRQAVEYGPSVANYHVNLAVAYRRAFRHRDAIEACERAVALRPDYVHAHLNRGGALFASEQYAEALVAFDAALVHAAEGSKEGALLLAYRGDTLRELGRLRAAVTSYERALEIAPDLPHAVSNLGLTLLEVGQPERGLELAHRATELETASGEVWMNLGTTLRLLDQLDEAMEAYATAHELAPDSAQLACCIGHVWLEVGDLGQAVQWFERALANEPGRVEAQCGLAAAALEADNAIAAVARYRTVLEADDDHALAWLGLGQALWADGDAEGAVEACRRAVELCPQRAGTLAQLGTILASSGDVDAANATNREALSVNPRCVGALANLAQNLRGQLDEADAAQMKALLDAPWVRDGARASLHFGLAHFDDGRKEYAPAAEHAIAANRFYTDHKRRRGWAYDPQDHERYVSRLIDTFTPGYFERTAGTGSPTELPVFIVGMPRSGTTLTEQIIASHPRAFGAGERTFASRAFAGLPRSLGRPEDTPLDCTKALTSEAVAGLADWHIEQLHGLTRKARHGDNDYDRVLDKMPDNYSLLGWIVTMFPRARIIHCRRDVRDVAVSCWMTQFKSIRWAFDLGHIAERILQYQRLMDHWRRVLPTPMLEIDYEETVADTPAQTERLLEHVGLSWDDACLSFHRTDRLVRTASVTQVRQPIYRRSLERWRRYEEALRPLLDRLGYEL